jgi:quercetin dioxygenase-like cupin family protein
MNTTSVRPEPLIQLGGSTITEHLGGEQTNGAVALMEFTIEPGFPVPPPHAHTHEDETTFVIEGALEITIGDETRTVDAGESIFKPRGVPHASAIAGEQRVRFLETITPAGFERYFRALAAIVRDTGMVDRATADRLMAEYGLRTP